MSKDIKRYVTIGAKVRFDPFENVMGFCVDACRHEVTGTVVEINKGHKWFSVEYGEPKQRTSFNFADIGKTVILLG